MSIKFFQNDKMKIISSPDFHSIFNKKTGFTATWGKTKDEDPQVAPVPLILDFEITEICNGISGVPCSYCYKSNTKKGSYTSLETAKNVIDKLWWVQQIAFGIDATGTSNPHMFDIFSYAHSKGIVTNLTIANVSDEIAPKLKENLGACAISWHEDDDICFNSVKKLTDLGMSQVNIHYVLHSKNLEKAYKIVEQSKTDSRLEKLNAIVFLGIKNKGRGKNGFSKVPYEEFKKFANFALDSGINIGWDSCSCNKFLKAISERENYEQLAMRCDPCESSCQSSYVNVKGEFFPCSFCENEKEWEKGIDVVNCKDFIKDVWMHPRVIEFRENLLKNNRNCPIYDI